MFSKKAFKSLLPGFTAIILTGCVTTQQQFYLNEEGSGKVRISATFQKMDIQQQGRDQKKADLDREDTMRLRKKVRNFISTTDGVEAWDSLDYGFTEDGQIRLNGVAYFPDITQLLFKKLPTLPVKHFSDDKIIWGFKPEPVDTTKPRSYRDSPLSKAEVKKRVKRIQRQFKQKSKMIKMAMTLFDFSATYYFPYKVKSVKGVEKEGKRSIKVSLDIEALMERIKKLMNNKEKLRDLVANKGVNGFDMDNKHILKAAFPDEPFKKVTFRTGLFSGSPENAFDYDQKVKAINPKKPEIPKVPE